MDNRNIIYLFSRAVLISIIGVLVIDYFSHLLFSNPMESGSYFTAKLALYTVFSLIFLLFINTKHREFMKVVLAGIAVSLSWGAYYNILPEILNYQPFGIPVYGLTFLGMGLFGTGLAFGIVHTLAFIGGYYSSKIVFKN